MARRVRARGGVLSLSNPSPELEETFRVIGFREIFESYGGTFKTTATAVPQLALAPYETMRLDVIIGDQVSLAVTEIRLERRAQLPPSFFAGLPGVSSRHLFFRNTGDHWLVEASDDPGSIVRVNDQVVPPSQKVVLSGDHTLQIGEVPLRVLVTSPEKSEEEVEPIQIQIEDVFSRTATWIERAISADQEKHE
jgi:hypothetical protein